MFGVFSCFPRLIIQMASEAKRNQRFTVVALLSAVRHHLGNKKLGAFPKRKGASNFGLDCSVAKGRSRNNVGSIEKSLRRYVSLLPIMQFNYFE